MEQEKTVQDETNCDAGVAKFKNPYTGKACLVLGNHKFISSNKIEINDGISDHLKMSRKAVEVANKKEV